MFNFRSFMTIERKEQQSQAESITAWWESRRKHSCQGKKKKCSNDIVHSKWNCSWIKMKRGWSNKYMYVRQTSANQQQLLLRMHGEQPEEEQLNHELFSVYSANYNQNPIKGFPPPEDTIKKCKCKKQLVRWCNLTVQRQAYNEQKLHTNVSACCMCFYSDPYVTKHTLH